MDFCKRYGITYKRFIAIKRATRYKYGHSCKVLLSLELEKYIW